VRKTQLTPLLHQHPKLALNFITLHMNKFGNHMVALPASKKYFLCCISSFLPFLGF
jgi:hypothetical protein